MLRTPLNRRIPRSLPSPRGRSPAPSTRGLRASRRRSAWLSSSDPSGTSSSGPTRKGCLARPWTSPSSPPQGRPGTRPRSGSSLSARQSDSRPLLPTRIPVPSPVPPRLVSSSSILEPPSRYPSTPLCLVLSWSRRCFSRRSPLSAKVDEVRSERWQEMLRASPLPAIHNALTVELLRRSGCIPGSEEPGAPPPRIEELSAPCLLNALESLCSAATAAPVRCPRGPVCCSLAKIARGLIRCRRSPGLTLPDPTASPGAPERDRGEDAAEGGASEGAPELEQGRAPARSGAFVSEGCEGCPFPVPSC